MKKHLALALLLLCTATSFAQQIKLNGYASYVFDDNIHSYYNDTHYFDGTIKGGLLWGAGLEVGVGYNQALELSYLRQSTTAPFSYYDQRQQNVDFGFDSNFILLGGTQYFGKPSGQFNGFIGWMAGVDIINVSNPNDNYSGSATKFAWGFKGGGDYWLSDAVAIKIQVQFLSVTQAVGGAYYYGPPGYYTTGVTTVSSMLQFGIGGGLVYKFNSGKK
jgi:hypothetical protein